MYGSPPVHGVLLVATILSDLDLKSLWIDEVKVTILIIVFDLLCSFLFLFCNSFGYNYPHVAVRLWRIVFKESEPFFGKNLKN